MTNIVMLIGVTAISTAFVAAIVALVSYILYYRDKQEKLLKLANRSFATMAAGTGLAIILLIISILSHNFQFNYVYSYSSTALNKFYLFSTLWAGQEGTFLMWLTFGAIYGFIMIKTVAQKNPLAMAFLVSVEAFLLLILLTKSPFATIWHVHETVPIGFTPVDGAGLNPLLQNPWMVIHPPTLFVGYSSTVVAFAFAMSAMVTKDFQGWIKQARPWVVFNVMILGTGIIMGGYWAYITLGWGGYWGWDPVENASLVPWLFSLILLHGMVIQSKRKALVRTNFLWAGMSFLTMLWGSYLTRSGVLTDFSVHSFAASGLNFYLMVFQLLFTSMFFYMLFRFMSYYSDEGHAPVTFGEGFLNRETMIFTGMMVFLFIAMFTLMGTSAPLYTKWFGTPASLSPDFYNTMILPISLIMLLATAIAPLLAWKSTGMRNLKTLWIGLGGAFVLTIVAVLLGLSPMTSVGEHTPYYEIEGTTVPLFMQQIRDFLFDNMLMYSPYLIFFLAAFAIIINVKISLTFIKNNFSKAGGYVAHAGLGLMAIGILTSSVYDASEKVMLPKGEYFQTEFGYEIKFLDFVKMPDGRDRVKLEVKTEYGNTYEAFPQFYYSEYSKAYMVSPDVKVQFAKDVYISPISFTPARLANESELELGKTETANFRDMQITFDKFDVVMAGNSQEVTANLVFNINENGYKKSYDVKPVLKASGGEMSSQEVTVPGTDYRVKIASVNASQGKVKLSIQAPGEGGGTPRDMLAIELSEKPLISVLWFGTIVFIIGSLLTLMNHVNYRRFFVKETSA